MYLVLTTRLQTPCLGANQSVLLICALSLSTATAIPCLMQWPQGEENMVPPAPGAVQIGVSVEPAAEIVHKEGSKFAARYGVHTKRAGQLYIVAKREGSLP